jgi:hypothetical protein
MGSYYKFEGYPGLYCNKVIAQRPMTAEEYLAVLEFNSPVMEGFVSKAGKTFSTKLIYKPEEKKITFDFPEGKALSTLCPKSKEPVQDMGTYYKFPGYPGTYFNKTVAKRVMTIEEYITALSSKEPVYLEGFVSQAEKPFTAALVYDAQSKRMNFQFAPRDGDAPKGKTKAPRKDTGASSSSSGSAAHVSEY